jgi:hypothetical protein
MEYQGAAALCPKLLISRAPISQTQRQTQRQRQRHTETDPDPETETEIPCAKLVKLQKRKEKRLDWSSYMIPDMIAHPKDLDSTVCTAGTWI